MSNIVAVNTMMATILSDVAIGAGCAVAKKGTGG